MIAENKILSENNIQLALEAQSICVHGDTFNAQRLVEAINMGFRENGILIQSF